MYQAVEVGMRGWGGVEIGVGTLPAPPLPISPPL